MRCFAQAAAAASPESTDSLASNMIKDTAALLVCAGSASRMGGINKILHPLGNSTVLLTGLRSMCACESIAELIVVCKPDEKAVFCSVIEAAGLPLPVCVVEGGATRQESVRNGFLHVSEACSYVAIHDGARPLVLPEDIARVIADARRTGAATLGVPAKDTIKVVRQGIITDTPDRSLLFQTQTPQVFSCELYRAAMKLAEAQGKDYTDDCQLIEALGRQVTMTTGDYSNLKLTTPEDFAIAEALLAMRGKESENG